MGLESEPHPTGDPSVARLLTNLGSQLRDLVQNELELARAELAQSVSRAASGGMMVAAGGLVAFAGFILLLHAAVFGLADLMEGFPLWAPAVIIAAIVLGIGLTLLLLGRANLRARSLAPRRTASSVKDDVGMVKEHIP